MSGAMRSSYRSTTWVSNRGLSYFVYIDWYDGYTQTMKAWLVRYRETSKTGRPAERLAFTRARTKKIARNRYVRPGRKIVLITRASQAR